MVAGSGVGLIEHMARWFARMVKTLALVLRHCKHKSVDLSRDSPSRADAIENSAVGRTRAQLAGHGFVGSVKGCLCLGGARQHGPPLDVRSNLRVSRKDL